MPASPVGHGKRFRVFARDSFRCCYCGVSAADDGVTLHIDHLIPLADGGSSEEENLVTACSECNLGKRELRIEPLMGASIEEATDEALSRIEGEVRRFLLTVNRYLMQAKWCCREDMWQKWPANPMWLNHMLEREWEIGLQEPKP